MLGLVEAVFWLQRVVWKLFGAICLAGHLYVSWIIFVDCPNTDTGFIIILVSEKILLRFFSSQVCCKDQCVCTQCLEQDVLINIKDTFSSLKNNSRCNIKYPRSGMLIMLGHDFLFNGQEYYLENHSSLLILLFLSFFAQCILQPWNFMLEMCQCIIQCFYLLEGTLLALSNEHFVSNSIVKTKT